jgi:zinc protease
MPCLRSAVLLAAALSITTLIAPLGTFAADAVPTAAVPADVVPAHLVPTQALPESPASVNAAPAEAAAVQKIDFTEETLPNGLRVIYAPLHQAPVVQVRVLYHVGSRDERPDRQGFAHMFEHMMFRGSQHVAPEEHMRLIDEVGGICNAFTSFDQTVYHDTVPSEDLGLALYLEADRMSSFKVTDQIYQIERKVVAQEWMLQQNRAFGNLYNDMMKAAFKSSSYQWTPIGNMQNLLAAPASELQQFYNTYYVPNNAVLVIAGDVNVPAAKKLVEKYFSWIPKGGDVPHPNGDEPAQTQMRSVTSPDRLAQLKAVVIGYHIPPYKSDDQYALSVLANILGEGASSRLEKALVNTKNPLCIQASTMDESLEYGGIFGVVGIIRPGKDAASVKEKLQDVVAELLKNGVTPEELERAKTSRRVEDIHGRETCEQIAGQVGDEELWAGDPNRVNTDLAKLDAVTAADVMRVANLYMKPDQATILEVDPDPLGLKSRKGAAADAANALKGMAPVVASTQPVAPREVTFPADYPQHPPIPPAKVTATFAKGQATTVNGIQLVVLTDNRLPVVSWTLAMRHGSQSEPADKAGLNSMTADMLSHGTKEHTFQQLSDEEESHGISIGVNDAGDHTTLSGSCTTDELNRAFSLSHEVLLEPTFPEDEFDKLKEQAAAGLMQTLSAPATAASRELASDLFAGSPLGQHSTPRSIRNITLNDVKKFYTDFYHPNDAVMVVSGDISFDHAKDLVKQMTDGWEPKDMPAVEYKFPPVATTRKIILIDTGDTATGAGSVVDMGIQAYNIHTDDKYAGSLASTLLSSGIESRLMEYVRAEKGYVYGVSGVFQPGREAGSFMVNAPTRPPVTGDCINSIFKVLDDLKSPGGDHPLTDQELDAAKRRTCGLMVMGMQTVGDQAGKRLDGLLNGYPIDYYDVYPQHINAVTADQVRAVLDKYVKDDAMTIVVAAPASVVKEQLDKLGNVEVLPMPLLRGKAAATQPADMLK